MIEEIVTLHTHQARDCAALVVRFRERVEGATLLPDAGGIGMPPGRMLCGNAGSRTGQHQRGFRGLAALEDKMIAIDCNVVLGLLIVMRCQRD